MAAESTEPAVEGDAVYEQTYPDRRSPLLNLRWLDAGYLWQLTAHLGLQDANAQVTSVATIASAVDYTPTIQQFLSLDPAFTGPRSISSFGED